MIKPYIAELQRRNRLARQLLVSLAIDTQRNGPLQRDAIKLALAIAVADVAHRQDVLANERLDGKQVRKPDYLLPLEYDGEKMAEFLLVPYFLVFDGKKQCRINPVPV